MEKDAGGKHHPKKLVVKLQPEAMSGRRWLRQQGVVTWWCAWYGTRHIQIQWTPSGWWFGTLFIFHNIWDNLFQLTFIFFRGVETTKQPTHNCRHLAWFMRSIVNLASQLGRYSSFPKTMLNYSKYHASGETRWFLRKTRIPIGLASHNPCLLLLVFLAQGRPGHHDDEGSDCAMAG